MPKFINLPIIFLEILNILINNLYFKGGIFMQIANIVISVANLVLAGVILGKLLKSSSEAEELERENAQLFFEQTTNEKY